MISVDLQRVREVELVLDSLLKSGWRLEDQIDRTTATVAGLSPRDALTALSALGDVTELVRVEGRRGGLVVVLKLVGDGFELESVSHADAGSYFEEPEHQEMAGHLQDREVEAALALPFQWRTVADLKIGKVAHAPKSVEVAVVNSWTWLTEWLASRERIERLVPSRGQRRLVLVLDFDGEPRHFGRLTIASHRYDLVLPEPALELASERSTEDRPNIAPSALEPLSEALTFDAVTASVASAFAYRVWAPLANDVSADEARLTFTGVRVTTAAPLASCEMDATLLLDTQRLYRWAYQDQHPDRLLSIRQVCSLYDGDEALRRPGDVLASAEAVFFGLRTEAVAEVMKGARDAQAQAMDAIRQSVKAVQDLTKSATERLLASLVAIAAVVVANSTRALSDDVGRNLLLLVAGFLAVLAACSLFLEGPLLSLPLAKLDEDLKAGNPFLTDANRKRASSLPSIGATRRRVAVTRAVVALTYIALALAILLWGDPARFT